MSIGSDAVKSLAGELMRAEQDRIQLAHFSKKYPSLSIEEAYAVQRAWIGEKTSRGQKIRGHKIGLTSRAMQQFSLIDEPDYGTLLDDMFFADGSEIPSSRFIVPHVEVELCFVLEKRLAGPDCTLLDVLAATKYVMPAIEIIDWRIRKTDAETGAGRKVVDTISDNAACAGVVLGGRPCGPLEVDLRWVSAVLYRNAVIECSGVAAAVLNHPANGPAWLANKLYAHGEELHEGEVILAGSFTSPVAAQAGDVFQIDYGPLGQVAFRFGA